MIITTFMAYNATACRKIVASDCNVSRSFYRRCRAQAVATTGHLTVQCPPPRLVRLDDRPSPRAWWLKWCFNTLLISNFYFCLKMALNSVYLMLATAPEDADF